MQITARSHHFTSSPLFGTGTKISPQAQASLINHRNSQSAHSWVSLFSRLQIKCKGRTHGGIVAATSQTPMKAPMKLPQYRKHCFQRKDSKTSLNFILLLSAKLIKLFRFRPDSLVFFPCPRVVAADSCTSKGTSTRMKHKFLGWKSEWLAIRFDE
jgi:hypothetical protein